MAIFEERLVYFCAKPNFYLGYSIIEVFARKLKDTGVIYEFLFSKFISP